MNKEILGGVLLALMLLSCLGVCENARAETITIVDGMNRSVEVPCPPERIVTLTSSGTELLCILGGMDRIVGRTEYCKSPPGIEEKAVVGSSYATINPEMVLELNPDVLIASRDLPSELVEVIQEVGIPVVHVSGCCREDQLIFNIQMLGKMVDNQEKAEELVEFVEKYVDLVRERTENLEPEEKPLVYHECREYKSNAAGTPKDEHITLAGGINIAHGESVKRPIVSGEWVFEMNPDIIIARVSSSVSPTEEGLKEKRDEILSRSGLKETNAVKNGDVYIYHPSLVWGPRFPAYLLYFAKWFHPELFEDINPRDVHEEALQRFYGHDLGEGTWTYPEIRMV